MTEQPWSPPCPGGEIVSFLLRNRIRQGGHGRPRGWSPSAPRSRSPAAGDGERGEHGAVLCLCGAAGKRRCLQKAVPHSSKGFYKGKSRLHPWF